MYITWFWIIVIIVVVVVLVVRLRQTVKNTYAAYLEQREITKVYMQISHNNVPPSKFAKQFVYRMTHEANISDNNLIKTLTAWGINSDTAKDLTRNHSDEDEQKAYDDAILRASNQMTEFLSKN